MNRLRSSHLHEERHRSMYPGGQPHPFCLPARVEDAVRVRPLGTSRSLVYFAAMEEAIALCCVFCRSDGPIVPYWAWRSVWIRSVVTN